MSQNIDDEYESEDEESAALLLMKKQSRSPVKKKERKPATMIQMDPTIMKYSKKNKYMDDNAAKLWSDDSFIKECSAIT